MPNFLELLRMGNIFRPQSQEMDNQPPVNDMFAGMNIPPPAPMPTGGQPFDVNARMKELYQPETAATDRFNQLVTEYPQYEKPGFWRSAAGALSAFGPGGHDVGMRVANFNNERRMADWKNQIGPAQQAASLERYNNANERQMAYQTVNQEIASRRQEATERNQTEQNRIRDMRARVYDYKARNPNAKIVIQRGGNILAINPTTGATIRDFGPSGTMSEEDKLDLQQEYAMERIGETGAQQRKTEETRQTGRETLQDQRAWDIRNIPDPSDPTKQISVMMNSITGEVKPFQMGGQNVGPSSTNTTSNRPELPTQTKVREFNAAAQLFNTRPDLRRFIKLNPNDNTFQIMESKPAQTFAGYTVSQAGPTPEQKAEIEAAIYGKSAPQPQTQFPSSGQGGGRGGGSGRGTQQPRFSDANPPPAPAGYRYVRKPGGGWTAVPLGQQ